MQVGGLLPLNVALFGQTAEQWRQARPDQKGNMRDYTTIGVSDTYPHQPNHPV